MVYGPSAILTNGLRTFKGGQLKIGTVKQTSGQTFPPVIPFGCPVGGLQPIPGGSCLATGMLINRYHLNRHILRQLLIRVPGDARLMQNPELTINEITLFRMHNHIAAGLQKANPAWNDNMLFAETRKILIAKYQHVTYTEVVPAIIGIYQTIE